MCFILILMCDRHILYFFQQIFYLYLSNVWINFFFFFQKMRATYLENRSINQHSWKCRCFTGYFKCFFDSSHRSLLKGVALCSGVPSKQISHIRFGLDIQNSTFRALPCNAISLWRFSLLDFRSELSQKQLYQLVHELLQYFPHFINF